MRGLTNLQPVDFRLLRAPCPQAGRHNVPQTVNVTCREILTLAYRGLVPKIIPIQVKHNISEK